MDEKEEYVIAANKTHITWSKKAEKQHSSQKGKEKAEASQQQASRELTKRQAREYEISMSKNKQTMQELWSYKPHVSTQVHLAETPSGNVSDSSEDNNSDEEMAVNVSHTTTSIIHI